MVKDLTFIKDVALHSLGHPVGIADMNGKIIYVNKACIKFWECTKEKDILGKHISEFSSTKRLLSNTISAIQQGKVYVFEDVLLKKDGTPFNFQVSADIIKSPDGKPLGIMAWFIDITEKKRTEEILKDSQDRFIRLINQSNDIIWRYNIGEKRMLNLNDTFESIYGISGQQFIANPNLWIEMVHPDDRIIAEKSGKKLLRDGHDVVEYRIVRPDGGIRWILDRKSVIYDKKGNPLEIGGFATDITKRKLLEEEIQLAKENLEQQVKEQTAELKNSHKQLRALASHLHTMLEAERISIARDIHDELGHLLTAIKIEIEELALQTNNLKKPYKNMLIPLINLVDAAHDSVRTIAGKLRPEVLDHFGLIPAMEWQLMQFQMRNRMELKYELGKIDFSFSNNESTAIFRIFQEILTNISRHSKATTVTISLKSDIDQIILKVKDNGTGFDKNKIAQNHSFGLLGMQERAIAIGGQFTIESIPGIGTTVVLLIRRL